MPETPPEDSLLLIRCPSCGQRFKVGEDLRNRTVECGACEHRFRITDDAIVRGRKFYPGERQGLPLNRFQRVPLPGGEKMIGMQPIRYANTPDPALLEPASPQRILAGIGGVLGMLFAALLLMFGGSSGGVLDGMIFEYRLVMAGFASLLGIALLVYANPRARKKSAFFGLLLAAGVVAVPFFFKSGSVLPHSRSEPTVVADDPDKKTDPELAAVEARIGTTPLKAEIQRLAREGSSRQAVGIWLRGMNAPNRYLVRDYLLRVSRADPASHDYPRDGGDRLFILTGITISLQEVAAFAEALGKVEKVYPELSVIEVQVNNENFVEGQIEKLSNKEDPAFYDLNKRELESIDLERSKRAVQRLAEAPPKLYRADITRKLITLLGEEGVDFKGNICVALSSWSELPGIAGEAALVEVKKLVQRNETVPPEMVALVVKERNPQIIPILDELWFKNPMAWESLYGDLGQAAEDSLLKRFPQTEGTIRYSAVRILGRIGSKASIPVLDEAAQKADIELRVLVDQAKKAINARAGA